MTHLLDTCICVSLIRRKSEAVRSRFEAFEIGDLVVSSITEAELRYGADKSMAPRKNHKLLDQMFLALPVIPFDKTAAVHYGKIRTKLERKGTLIGPLDLLIAAHGKALGLTVVTDNLKEFARVPGLKVENWG